MDTTMIKLTPDAQNNISWNWIEAMLRNTVEAPDVISADKLTYKITSYSTTALNANMTFVEHVHS